jgi:DNA modification methylase
MFPNEGPYRCILAGCPKGRIVLDPFSGLATTGIEAIRLGCNYIGVDLPQKIH